MTSYGRDIPLIIILLLLLLLLLLFRVPMQKKKKLSFLRSFLQSSNYPQFNRPLHLVTSKNTTLQNKLHSSPNYSPYFNFKTLCSIYCRHQTAIKVQRIHLPHKSTRAHFLSPLSEPGNILKCFLMITGESFRT